MNQSDTKLVMFTIPDEMYIQLIELLDKRIKSERGRVSAFKCHADRSNHMIAVAEMGRLKNLRNAIVEGAQEVGDV